MATVRALAVPAPGAPVEPAAVERRDPRPDDVVVDIRYVGICHSDIHQAHQDWGPVHFPLAIRRATVPTR
jgi:uncharacterized zinc-type alcohol dehydrogenase-like protein